MLMLPTSRIEELVQDPFALSREALEVSVRNAVLEALRPSPKLNGREWVEKHGVHSVETSSRSGKFELFPFQADMLELMTDPEWRKTALMKSARVGYTQIATFLLGYYTEHDPAKSAFILPTEADIGEYSKDSLNPMLRDIKALARLAGGVSMNDRLNRFFGNGSVIYLRSAFSSDKLRRITAGNIFCDEVDAEGWDTSGQGDKVDLAEMRALTISGSKFFAGSTPLLKGSSRIEGLFERGTMHKRFVPCPHCTAQAHPDLFEEANQDWWVFGELMADNGVVFEGHQVLEWGDGETFGIHYKTDPENPVYICRHCAEHIPHELKGWMDLHGEFRPTNFDEDGNPAWEKGFLSLHISALYSQFEGASWARMVQVWKSIAGDAEKMQTFYNNWLGQSFEDWSAAGKVIQPHELQVSHVVDYGAEVPKWVRFLTAGGDMQSKDGGRFEVKVVGWGAGQRKAVIGHFVLDQHPLTDPTAWMDLEKLLSRSFRTMDGRRLFISGAALDSGSNNASFTQEMYDFSARNLDRSWWAVKGHGQKGRGNRGIKIWEQGFSKKGVVFKVEVDIAKDQLFRQINSEPDAPAGIVFPANPPEGSVNFDKLYFERLTRERPLPVKGRPGKTYWSSPTDQEPWDCLVYAVAAMHGLLEAFPRRYESLVATPVKPVGQIAQAAKPAGASTPKAAPRPKPKQPGRAKTPAWLRL